MSGSQTAKKFVPEYESQPKRLTKNERLVFSVLRECNSPMKAYELLAALKQNGIKAPMTVYRALDRLEQKGLIHKLDALNSFVICNHENPHPVQAFLICATCNKAVELAEHEASGLDWHTLEALADSRGFNAHSARLEVRGTCTDCG